MRDTIRARFTLIFGALMIAVLVSIWAVNNWWLESYYMNEKIRILETAYEEIDDIILRSGSDDLTDDAKSNEEISAVMRTLNEESGVARVVFESSSGLPLFSSASDMDFRMDNVRRYIVGIDIPSREVLRQHENYAIQRAYDSRSKSVYLESWGFFSDNGTIFIMSLPLSNIRESVHLANRFLAYVGLAAIILSSILLYVTIRRLTAPILELARLSEEMSHMNFEVQYREPRHSMQELRILGNNMNVLAERLKENIGELKSANNQLKKDIEEKIQLNEMRKEFIGNVSHELKTPIALIQGYAEGLSEGIAEDKESRDYYCEVIMDEANKMNQLVKQLLTLNALEDGNDAPVFERFDLSDLIGGVVNASALLAQQKGIRIHFESPGPVYVWADEFKIEEVITNYLNNALNHADGEKNIVISIHRESGCVRVTVFNNGNPIPEKDLPNLWTKFYKVDKARTRAYGGSGIGLSIVKAIMEAHHQQYGVRNVEDGVEFWFTLDCTV